MPTALAVSVAVASPERRGRAVALVTSGLTVATVIGVPLGNLVGSLLGWRATFAMVALIGADEAQANEVCARAAGDGILVPANFNAPGQIVLSGSIDACDRAIAVAGDVGVRATKLQVAGAFHSPLMAPGPRSSGRRWPRAPSRPFGPRSGRM